MLRWIRGTRVGLETGIVLIVIALAGWALVVYVNVRDFVPQEFRDTLDVVPESPAPPEPPVAPPGQVSASVGSPR